MQGISRLALIGACALAVAGASSPAFADPIVPEIIGLWNANDLTTPIATATIDQNAIDNSQVSQIADWLFAALPQSVVLSAGNYVVGAQGGEQYYTGNIGVTTASTISYVEAAFSVPADLSTLTAPTPTSDSSTGLSGTTSAGYFGGNILLDGNVLGLDLTTTPSNSVECGPNLYCPNPYNLGFEFTVAQNTTVTVAGLGVFDNGSIDTFAIDPPPVPEPMSLSLFGGALLGFGLLRRRRNVVA